MRRGSNGKNEDTHSHLPLSFFIIFFMSAQKRPADTAATSNAKRSSSHDLLSALHADTDTFFYIFPLDCITYLRPFLPPRRGRVKNPTALRRVSKTTIDFLDGQGICIDRHGHVLVRTRSRVRAYNCVTGKVMCKFATVQFPYAAALVADSTGRIYASQTSSNCVDVYREDGTLEKSIDIYRPSSMALSLDEQTLYVGIYDGPALLKTIRTSDMIVIGEIGQDCSCAAHGIAVLSTGEVIVSVFSSPSQLFVFMPGGQFARIYAFGVFGDFRQLAVDANDDIYAVDEDNDRIVVLSREGMRVSEFVFGDNHMGLYGVAIDQAGRVIVANSRRSCIEVLSSE